MVLGSAQHAMLCLTELQTLVSFSSRPTFNSFDWTTEGIMRRYAPVYSKESDIPQGQKVKEF